MYGLRAEIICFDEFEIRAMLAFGVPAWVSVAPSREIVLPKLKAESYVECYWKWVERYRFQRPVKCIPPFVIPRQVQRRPTRRERGHVVGHSPRRRARC